MEESRKKKVVIDVGEIETSKQLQLTLKENLDFPEFYGGNWDAFWDTITGLVMLPEIVIVKNWGNLAQCLPEEASYLESTLKRYSEERPEDDWQVEVKYD